MRLSPEELDREYRSALRRIAQERTRGDAFRDALLRVKGHHMLGVQRIDELVELVEREHRVQQTGLEMEAIAAKDGARLDLPT